MVPISLCTSGCPKTNGTYDERIIVTETVQIVVQKQMVLQAYFPEGVIAGLLIV